MSKSVMTRHSRAYRLLRIYAVLSLFYITQAQAGQVTLAWDASGSLGVVGYEVSYGLSSGSYTANVDVGSKTTYTLTGLQDGKKYYFAAKAYTIGKAIRSGVSNEVSATISSPGGGGGNAGLVGAYDFEEASGSAVVDASGQGNRGAISGATRITQGRYGKALAFDGVNDWVTVNDAPSLDLTSGMTLEAWVYPTMDMTDWATVIQKEQKDGVSYYLSANSDTYQPATGLSVAEEQILRGGPWLFANQWTHLAATYDGAIQRLYVNGTQVAQRAQAGPIQASSSPLRLGGNSVYDEYFQGRIDEVRIYNRALSAQAIRSDMAISIANSNKPVTLVATPTTLSGTDSLPEGRAQAFQAKAALTEWVTSHSVYLDGGSTATKVVAALYANSSGHPSTLLTQDSPRSPGSGAWESVPILPTRITSGTTYWIAIGSLSGPL